MMRSRYWLAPPPMLWSNTIITPRAPSRCGSSSSTMLASSMGGAARPCALARPIPSRTRDCRSGPGGRCSARCRAFRGSWQPVIIECGMAATPDPARSRALFFWAVAAATLLALWLRAWGITIQVVLDDEWHALHKLVEASYSGIFKSFGLSDHSIPLTLFYKWMADNFC